MIAPTRLTTLENVVQALVRLSASQVLRVRYKTTTFCRHHFSHTVERPRFYCLDANLKRLVLKDSKNCQSGPKLMTLLTFFFLLPLNRLVLPCCLLSRGDKTFAIFDEQALQSLREGGPLVVCGDKVETGSDAIWAFFFKRFAIFAKNDIVCVPVWIRKGGKLTQHLTLKIIERTKFDSKNT